MHFKTTGIAGLWLIEIIPKVDHRGYFARTFCEREFAENGLRSRMVQDSVGHSHRKGTLRGMHYHAAGYPQARFVRCTSGAAFFVVLDLRPKSSTFLQFETVELDVPSRRALYLAPGLALGYQTRVDNTDVYYQMSEYYAAEHERGVRWNDPAFGITWPDDERTINARDATYADFDLALVEGLGETGGDDDGHR